MLTTENTILLVIDFQERMINTIRNHDEIVQKTATMIKGCRLLEVPILTTQQYTKGLGETIETLKEALGNFEHIEKITFSCYIDKTFEEALRKAERKNVIVTGIEAHICVQQTVLHLLEAGYNVYLIADCIGSRSENDFHYAIKRMQQAGAAITTTESALFEMLIRADHPKRKDITNLVK